jgi:hypothetical protein
VVRVVRVVLVVRVVRVVRVRVRVRRHAAQRVRC